MCSGRSGKAVMFGRVFFFQHSPSSASIFCDFVMEGSILPVINKTLPAQSRVSTFLIQIVHSSVVVQNGTATLTAVLQNASFALTDSSAGLCSLKEEPHHQKQRQLDVFHLSGHPAHPLEVKSL